MTINQETEEIRKRYVLLSGAYLQFDTPSVLIIGSVITENLTFQTCIENLKISNHGTWLKLSYIKGFHVFSLKLRSRSTKSLFVEIIMIFSVQPAAKPPIRDLIKIHTTDMLIMEALLFTFI